MKADFLLKRLARMSPAEIICRTLKLAQAFMDKRYSNADFDCTIIYTPGSLFKENFSLPVSDDLIREADLICNNCFSLFALKECNMGEKIDYHKDYKSGLTANKNLYYTKIDYRDTDSVGDIKYIWELNRHLFLTKLASAYRMTGEEKYRESLMRLLTEWVHQNPFMMGVNWGSSLELGIRLINWTLSYHLMESTLEDEVRRTFIKSVYQHCWHISRNFSHFSSANNHVIGEAAGLFIASTALPGFKKTSMWQKQAHKILVREALKQNHLDGVNKEQAVAYHIFVYDLLLLAGLVGKRYGMDFSESYWDILESMAVYLASIQNFSSVIPHIGDDDDGYVFDLGQKAIGAHKSVLHTSSLIFSRNDFQFQSEQEDLKTNLLMGIREADLRSTSKAKQKPLREQFEQGGYYILNQKSGTTEEQKLIFDCGPLGYLSLAAHGHSDALSFYFSAGGCPVFIDPGTYAYHTNQRWRNYFRSTKGHNTACLNNQNQSLSSGNFMWSRKACSKLLEYRPGTYVKGMHDGYKGNYGIIHERTLEYRQEENFWVVVDEFRGSGSHGIEIAFHLEPSCRIENKDEFMLSIRFPNGLCNLYHEKGLERVIYCGDNTLPLGWYSPSYDLKFPTHTIILKKQIEGNFRIETRFNVIFDIC